MRVALGQLDMVWEDRSKSIQKAVPMIIDAAKQKADIIIFPEMSFTGFSMNTDLICEDMDTSYTVSKMKQLARENNIAIGFGWAAKPSDHNLLGEQEIVSDASLPTNRFSIVDREGTVIADYAKIHPFTYGGETQHYAKGQNLVNVPFLGRNISLLICYDLRFPALLHVAAKRSDIIFVIANWPGIRRAHWQTLLRARAIESQSYIVGVNCVGDRDGSHYDGDSMAIDSIGNIIGSISGREGVLICDLDDKAWRLREKFSIAADRREELYQEFYHRYELK